MIGSRSYGTIVAAGGIQDAIDANWYDGTTDSFYFVSAVPEASSVILLFTMLLGVAFAARKRITALRKNLSGLARATDFGALAPHSLTSQRTIGAMRMRRWITRRRARRLSGSLRGAENGSF